MIKKKKILYVVSNLRRTGPVNQLSYIISFLDSSKFECKVLTLSAEPIDSKLLSYKENGVDVDSLFLSRIKGLLFGETQLSNYIRDFSPDVIQTQGIRADTMVCNLKLGIPWITTSRNFPTEDYPSKFGWFKGGIMAKKHINVLSRCASLVSCSYSIASKLEEVGIPSKVISNGVPLSYLSLESKPSINLNKVKFISIGSLIARKNMILLVELFNSFHRLGLDHELIVLGDGPLLNELKKKSNDNVSFLGNVENVDSFLLNSDVFLSSSLSEGLPNTVLEAISFGVPVILSDIPPHNEITNKLSDNSGYIFSVNTEPDKLAEDIQNVLNKMIETNPKLLAEKANLYFGAETMSDNYQKLYEEVING